MKKLFLPLVSASLMALSISAQADGIKFEKGDWASVLEKASRENKPVMVDFYTDWCGPCKQMVRDVFPLDEVGAFYNKHFVNYKIDAEKGEGPELAQKYAVQAYPTYIFTDGKGEFLHQAVGAFNAEKFIGHGKTALDPEERLSNLVEKNSDSQISKADMPAHLRKLKDERLPYNDQFEAYIKSLSDKELYSKEAFELLVELGGYSAEGFAYDLILAERNKFARAVGQKPVNDYVYRKLLGKAYGLKNDGKSYQPVLDQIREMNFPFVERMADEIKLTDFLHGKHDYKAFAEAAPGFLKKYGKQHPSLKYSPVFAEAVKFFHRDPHLDPQNEQYLLQPSMMETKAVAPSARGLGK